MIDQMTDVVQGALRQERKLENISNHLANASTTGFKADILSFDETLRAHTTIDFTPGDLQHTGNKLDLALTGDGLFAIQTDQGVRYSRNGTFTLNEQNMLVNFNGQPVLGENGPIYIDGNVIEINEAGEVWVDRQQVGRLKIVRFADEEKLIKQGETLFRYSGSLEDEQLPENVSVRQGSLETSNIVSVIEMTKMIETVRSYESYQKVLQSLDETDAKAINEVGKVS